MKNNLLIIAFTLSSFFAFAQQEITIEDTLKTMSKGEYNAFYVLIPQTTLKDVDKKWQKYLTADSKAKPVEANGEINITGTLVPNISPNPINIYSKLLETTEGVKLTAWFTENDSSFLSKQLNAEQDLAVQKFVRDFAVEQYKAAAKKEADAEQDKLKALDKELNALIKSEEKSTKKISENERSIQRAKDNIVTNNSDLMRKENQINDQKRMVERTLADENANKGAKKTLKDLENEKKQLTKDRESNNKDIDKWYKEIREEERNIQDMKQQQKVKAEEVEKQKAVVKAAEDKFSNIK